MRSISLGRWLVAKDGVCPAVMLADGAAVTMGGDRPTTNQRTRASENGCLPRNLEHVYLKSQILAACASIEN